MKNNKKIVAVLGAMSTLLTTGCTINVDEKKLIDKLGEFGIEISKDGDNVEVKVDETKLSETTTTATYTTELTQTTTMTEPTVLTNSTTVTSVNPTTVSTTNTTLSQTTGTTTTGTTTTVVEQLNNELNEPKYETRESSFIIPEKAYTISDEYIVKGKNSTVSCKGEGLYSIVCKLNNGKYNKEIVEEIKNLNNLKEDFVAEGTKLKVPFTLVYCKGISAEDVFAYSEVSLNEIKDLNGILDSKEEIKEENGLIVKALKKDQKAYETENGKIQNIMYDTVISGDMVIECTNTYKEDSLVGFIIINRKSKYENVVEYMEMNKDGYRSGYVIAENVNIDKTKASNGNAVIVCNNQADMYSYNVEEGKAEENYRTVLYKQTLTNEYYMHRSAEGTVAITLSDINVPGYEQYNTIGGKQKTK